MQISPGKKDKKCYWFLFHPLQKTHNFFLISFFSRPLLILLFLMLSAIWNIMLILYFLSIVKKNMKRKKNIKDRLTLFSLFFFFILILYFFSYISRLFPSKKREKKNFVVNSYFFYEHWMTLINGSLKYSVKDFSLFARYLVVVVVVFEKESIKKYFVLDIL